MSGNLPSSILQQVVSGLSEGVLLLSLDGGILWANEAALTMHGARHLDDLGGDAAGYRRRFRLKNRRNQLLRRGQTPIDRLLAGEEVTDVIVQVFRPSEDDPAWVHRVRTLAAHDAAAGSTCLVVVVNDATERFEAEERFEATFAANPAPAIICRVADKRFVKVNAGFTEMTGIAREVLLAQTIHDFDVLAGAERRALAANRLEAAETIPQMEALLRLPDGRSKAVVVAGQPIEVTGEPCILFTFADLEPRTKVESALRESEARFQSAFRLSPVPTVLLTDGGPSISALNDAFVRTFGWSETDAIGKTFAELDMWIKASDREAFDELSKGKPLRDLECCIRPRAGGERDCLISAEGALVNGERSFFCVLQDISDRKRSERDIQRAIDAAITDTSWLARSILEKLTAAKSAAEEDTDGGASLDQLSGRERQVLTLIWLGATDEDIGKRLGLARNTVRNHVAALYRRLGVHSRSEAVIWARDKGLTGAEALPIGSATKPAD